ncbi:hypothetical protein IT157_01760 [bacterium]|jgi:hypothetical protein|nr:hypothetical protein [bacterium]
MESLLLTEIKTFEDNRLALLGRAKEKYALVKGDQIVGVYDAKLDAIRQGYQMFGNVPFLVKLVTEVDIPLNFVTNYFD